MLSFVLSWLLPLTFSLSCLWPVFSLSFTRRLGVLEKVVLGMALSVSLYLALVSVYATGQLPHLSGFIHGLVILGTGVTLWGIFQLKKRPKPRLTSLSSPEKLVIIVLAILITKILLLYSTHPIVDPDIITTYLPFARSIVRAGHVPPIDYYTANPMTIPPIGGPILFATYYFLSHSLTVENFRFLTWPFLLGIGLLTYLFARKSTTRLNSLIAMVIFFSLPVIDGMLSNWILYPDIIYSFLGLTAFYFGQYYLFRPTTPNRLIYSLIFGTILASTLLLKSQGLLVIYVFGLIALHQLSAYRKYFYLLTVVLTLAPFVLSYSAITGVTGFGYAPLNPLALCIYLFAMLFSSHFYHQPSGNSKSQSIYPLIFTLIFTIPGFVWLIRNYTSYGNISVPLTSGYGQFYGLARQLHADTPAQRLSFSGIAFLLGPSFGTFFLLPKVVGFFNLFKTRKLLLPLFWSIFIYTLSIVFFGDANNRYLLPVFPVLAIMITFGIEKIASWYRQARPSKLAPKLALLLGFVLLSLTQSDFIFWNFGPAFSYFKPSQGIPAAINQTIEPPRAVSSPTLITLKSGLQAFREFLGIMSGHVNLPFIGNHQVQLFIIGLVGGLAVLVIVKLLLSRCFGKYLFIICSAILLLPYLFVVWRISGGAIWRFAQKEQELIYNNFGEVTYVSPYLKAHASPGSTILIFGPQTGTAYQTNLAAWNIESGYGLKELFPVIHGDDASILDFFANHSINYAVFARDPHSLELSNHLRAESRLLDVIENPQYFQKINSANLDNIWEIYARRLSN